MNQQEWIKIFVLMIKLIGGVVLVTVGRRLRKQARWIALAASVGSLALFIAYLPALQAGVNIPFELNYMPELGIKLSLNIDWLSFPFLLTEEFVTIFAIIYSLGYIKTDEKTHLFYGLLLIFLRGYVRYNTGE